VPGRECEGGAEGGHLRKSKIDENDAAPQDVQTEIGMNGDE
jgi:hypothetical protein